MKREFLKMRKRRRIEKLSQMFPTKGYDESLSFAHLCSENPLLVLGARKKRIMKKVMKKSKM